MTKDFKDYPVTLQSVATVSEFRKHLAHYIASVRYGRDRVEIRRKDMEPVYLVSAADFEAIAARIVEIDEGPVASWGGRDTRQTYLSRMRKRMTHIAKVWPGREFHSGMPEVYVTRDAPELPYDYTLEADKDEPFEDEEEADAAVERDMSGDTADRHPHPKEVVEREPPEGSQEAIMKERSARLMKIMTDESERKRWTPKPTSDAAEAQRDHHLTEQDIREEEERLSRMTDTERKLAGMKKGTGLDGLHD